MHANCYVFLHTDLNDYMFYGIDRFIEANKTVLEQSKQILQNTVRQNGIYNEATSNDINKDVTVSMVYAFPQFLSKGFMDHTHIKMRH